MSLPKVIWVTPSNVSKSAIESAMNCPIDGVQLRCKEMAEEFFLDLARFARKMTHQTGKHLSINSSLKIALEVKADSVHLPESMTDLCPYLGGLPGNVSTHSLKAALRAESLGAEVITFGPIFETPSKKNYGPPQGLDALKEVVKALSIPVYAIGGITLDNRGSCLQYGAVGVMMQRGIVWS